MRTYFFYYLAWIAISYLVQRPALLVGLVVVFLLRNHIPDPRALVNALQRTGLLERQIAVNPSNVVARRDLATVYLDLRRPAKAAAVLAPALERGGNDPELAFLYGLALHRSARSEEALPYFVKSVEERAIRYGEPYRAAGDALLALGRVDGAIDAYERYASINHSDVGVHASLARAHAAAGETDAVRASLAKALDTFAHLPAGMRRRALGPWIEAQWLRARLLRTPHVVLAWIVALGVVVVAAWGISRGRLGGHSSTEPLRSPRGAVYGPATGADETSRLADASEFMPDASIVD